MVDTLFNVVIFSSFLSRFFASFASLIPPPLIDLLLRHEELILKLIPHLLDALSSPHHIFAELISKNSEFPLSLPLSLLAKKFTILFAPVTKLSLNWTESIAFLLIFFLYFLIELFWLKFSHFEFLLGTPFLLSSCSIHLTRFKEEFLRCVYIDLPGLWTNWAGVLKSQLQLIKIELLWLLAWRIYFFSFLGHRQQWNRGVGWLVSSIPLK